MLLRILLPIILILGGCATSGPINPLPKLSTLHESGQVTVIRPSAFIGSAGSLTIALDGIEIFHLNNGEYTTFSLSTGPHTLAVRCFGGWTPTWKEDVIDLTVSPGDHQYAMVEISMECADISHATEPPAETTIKDLTFIDPHQI